MAKPELVAHDTFYMKELNELVNLKEDYDVWRTRQDKPVGSFFYMKRKKTVQEFVFS